VGTLIMVADLVGDEWAQRAREACVAFVTGFREDTASVGVRLLSDLRDVFDADEVLSTEVGHEAQDATEAVGMYRLHLLARPDLVAAARAELRGRTLACWCRPSDPCHADVLLEMANAPGFT
jgi:hypothetical protein